TLCRPAHRRAVVDMSGLQRATEIFGRPSRGGRERNSGRDAAKRRQAPCGSAAPARVVLVVRNQVPIVGRKQVAGSMLGLLVAVLDSRPARTRRLAGLLNFEVHIFLHWARM